MTVWIVFEEIDTIDTTKQFVYGVYDSEEKANNKANMLMKHFDNCRIYVVEKWEVR